MVVVLRSLSVARGCVLRSLGVAREGAASDDNSFITEPFHQPFLMASVKGSFRSKTRNGEKAPSAKRRKSAGGVLEEVELGVGLNYNYRSKNLHLYIPPHLTKKQCVLQS